MRLLTTFVLAVFFVLQASSTSSYVIRSVFHKAGTDAEKLEAIYTSDEYGSGYLVKAYKGLCRVMMAESAFWPTAKWQRFTEGRDMIESVISAHPNDIELRYIRLMVQLNAPSMLGYDDDIENDLDKFITGYSQADFSAHWKAIFVENLTKTKYISTKQKKRLEILNQRLGEK